MPKSKQRASDLVTCDRCGVNVRARGLGSHSRSCAKKEREQQEDEEFVSIVQKAEKKGEHSNQLSFNDVLDRWLIIFFTELRRQRRKIRNNLQRLEDAQSSAGEHSYFNNVLWFRIFFLQHSECHRDMGRRLRRWYV